MTKGDRPGFIGRVRRALFSPSLRWSVAALLGLGLVVGAGAVISTQVALAVTGTDEFCGNTCHSHEKFVFPEHKLSAHYTGRTGVRAMCIDCHVPHSYPAKIIYKAQKGMEDAYAELRGTISTQAKFDAARWRLANVVW
ncbi:MAG: NapC/NirT family cytochrome c, partial [Ideonella sp.]